MSITKTSILKVALIVFISTTLFSCNKSTDVISEYVVTEQVETNSNLLASDTYSNPGTVTRSRVKTY